jgi:putative transposase
MMDGGGEEKPGGHKDQGGGTNQGGVTPPLRKSSLGQIVGFFKHRSAKEVNLLRGSPGLPLWQRNYYERVIRNDAELSAIREYIRLNPQQWLDDKENPTYTP